jgi:hypothetical protein
MRITLLLLLLFAAVFPVSGQVILQRVLLPISIPDVVQGNFGTLWTTTTFAFNDSAEPATVYPFDCDDSFAVPCAIEPRVTLHIDRRFSSTNPATFFYVDSDSIERMRFTSLLREVSHPDQIYGATLPIARESDFRSRIVIPFVPLNGTFRTALRIYGFDSAATTVRLRLYRLDRIDPFVDEVVQLSEGIVSGYGHVVAPSIVQILDLVGRWPQLQAAASVRVEIDTIDPATHIWALASTTNRDTQAVTVFTSE